ncbi:MAG TPA: response regulator transcription factor [Bacteroidales bacterium]|nr:response regulator transcription factor [Bacteroidales bacterium]HPF02596.1 response regulator transcription factor [Bacteroidales bacterium]HPJ59814.1 response regulator transcription factor [Bacteroidales bacterium]HPR13042.1 response regulator transcription factor [Bacteroidales bacterium]HRW85865.1 response regulator transcription factor [Bacteroidales bacterium]
MKVLLAEDDRDFGNILSQYVSINGFDVTLARDGMEAWELFQREKPDICVLDVMMPEMDGFTLGEKIKEKDPDIPLIYLTAKSLKEDIVRGLKIGADDYITKPFDPEVLILRINNILKRAYSSSNDEFSISDTVLKISSLELICGKNKEKLTLKEAQLLRYFIINKNKVLTREDILTEIWGEDDYFLGRSMDVFISRLRKYISEDKNLDIRTVRGTGFILEELNREE